MNKPLKSLVLLMLSLAGFAQASRQEAVAIDSTNGYYSLTTPSFTTRFLTSSHVLSALIPAEDSAFNYVPGSSNTERVAPGFYHLGDINIRYRTGVDKQWSAFSSAAIRESISIQEPTHGQFVTDLSPYLPHNAPLTLKRIWEQQDGKLVLRFELHNLSDKSLEIGSLGLPMIFNNVLGKRSLDATHAENVFYDPYVGLDAGYLMVNRLHGRGSTLLVLPHQNAGFEAYSPLNDDPTPRGVTFEGFYEWMVHSKAHAENEWKGVEQWNTPTSLFLEAGQLHEVAVRIVQAPSIREVEATLVKEGMPVAVGLPGYVVPMDEAGSLHLKYGSKLSEIKIYPYGSMQLTRQRKNGEWQVFSVSGKEWGRTRVTLQYADGKKQSVHYKVIKPQQEVVQDLGRFLTTEQWFEDPDDPFGRSPSIMTYDYEERRLVTQERRAWFAGLSDEAGAGSWLAAFMKQLLLPDSTEMLKLERFTSNTLWGGIQHSTGPHKYGVKKSLFYYAPDEFNVGFYRSDVDWKVWSAWSKEEASRLDRSYNYPHVAVAHWVLYKTKRRGAEAENDATAHLLDAYETAMAMVKFAPYYAQYGQMEGSVFRYILSDLLKEGKMEEAEALEAAMRVRAERWKTLAYPFGSEMPWDSTGQEEVYLWSAYFGNFEKAKVTLDAILAYTPAVPHWGYNGSARRYWDFVYGGKLARIERQLHHYGSALNAIPVMEAYRTNPDDFHLLRIGYAGWMGALANVTREGFGPAAFHAYPSTMDIDGISGDYGSGFYGYAVNVGTYLAVHPVFGPVVFGGNLARKGKWIITDLTTPAQNTLFIAPEKIRITTEGGAIAQAHYHSKSGELRLTLLGHDASGGTIYLEVDGPSVYNIPFRRDALGRYRIPMAAFRQTVALRKRN